MFLFSASGASPPRSVAREMVMVEGTGLQKCCHARDLVHRCEKIEKNWGDWLDYGLKCAESFLNRAYVDGTGYITCVYVCLCPHMEGIMLRPGAMKLAPAGALSVFRKLYLNSLTLRPESDDNTRSG